ncbi:hypothetical protein ACQ4PT_070319 [Festuca glaucescens]
MPATDSDSSSPAHHTSFGRSILSLRHRDQIHHGFPPTPDHSHSSSHASSSDDREIDAFQRHAADLLLDLLPSPDPSASPIAPEILSLDWTRHLLDSFLICLEEFRSVLFADAAALARAPLDRLLADFFDRAVKALDLCNALRDGIDLLRQWRKHLAIAAAALAPSRADPAAPLGEGQIRRARKALTDLTILMLDDKDAGGGGGQRNRSFGRGPAAPKDGQGRGHHRRSSSGSGSGSGSHFRSLSWSVSRSWSASRQLQAIGGNLPVPRPHDMASTGGLASAVYTMGAVLFVTAWALVAAIPCQDRGLQAHFTVPRSGGFPWAGPVTALYDRVLEESKKKERKHSCGLLKEIHQIERCSRQLMEVTDAAQFPLDDEKEAEVQEAAQELVQVCETLKDGLDPLERQVREMFHRIVRTRTEILDYLSRPNTTE